MPFQITRKRDNRVVKCILHRIADIPGGVTVSVANLGGSALFEGTPLGVGSDGMFKVVKTAQIVTAANDSATTYEVAKGHHFKAGDRFAVDGANGQVIATVDKSDPAKDVITVSTTLGVAVAAGACAFESNGESQTLAVTPVVIAGSNEDVEAGNNLFVSAWVHAVVRKQNAPIVNAAIESALKCVSYV